VLRWIWIILGALGSGIVLFVAVVAMIWFSRPEIMINAPSTPIVRQIDAPTPTTLPPTHTPDLPTPTPLPDDQGIPQPPAEGEFAIGHTVKVSGTGRDGLRFRTEPGLKGSILFLGVDAEEFTISNGPEVADGYTWWYLTGIEDPSRRGWAVSNYLRLLESP
jgi:hypothetical protein